MERAGDGQKEEIVKKQVLTYVKPASELKAGDRILTTRGSSMTVGEVESVEAFEDSTKRPCVVIVVRNGRHIVAATNFLADETVLIVE